MAFHEPINKTEVQEPEPQWKWVNVKVPKWIWLDAKTEAIKADKFLAEWIAEAIVEKLQREGVGKVSQGYAVQSSYQSRGKALLP